MREACSSAARFEWIAPSGRGLLTHYMPAPSGRGGGDSSATLQEAEDATYLLSDPEPVRVAPTCLLPVGTDYTPRNMGPEIHRDWNARDNLAEVCMCYTEDFFASVRDELSDAGSRHRLQTRDITRSTPLSRVPPTPNRHPGRRDGCSLRRDFFAGSRACGRREVPSAARCQCLGFIWRRRPPLRITGSSPDQVYLDLLYRMAYAWELADVPSTMRCPCGLMR